MGLPVTLQPNATDLSCTFKFGIPAPPLHMEKDLLATECLIGCASGLRKIKKTGGSCLGSIDHQF